jgi:hypothetical protein
MGTDEESLMLCSRLLLNNSNLIYDFQHNGKKCSTIINSEHNLNECMSNNLSDASMPDNCKALLHYDIELQSTAVTVDTEITSGTGLTSASPTFKWVPLCIKFNTDCVTELFANIDTDVYTTCTSTNTHIAKEGCLALYDYYFSYKSDKDIKSLCSILYTEYTYDHTYNGKSCSD